MNISLQLSQRNWLAIIIERYLKVQFVSDFLSFLLLMNGHSQVADVANSLRCAQGSNFYDWVVNVLALVYVRCLVKFFVFKAPILNFSQCLSYEQNHFTAWESFCCESLSETVRWLRLILPNPLTTLVTNLRLDMQATVNHMNITHPTIINSMALIAPHTPSVMAITRPSLLLVTTFVGAGSSWISSMFT